MGHPISLKFYAQKATFRVTMNQPEVNLYNMLPEGTDKVALV